MKKKNFVVIRHGYDDHSYIDGKNDTALTIEGIEMAKSISAKVMKTINTNKVIIRHSTKLRAEQTAKIICDYIMRYNIECEVIRDNGLTELYQGKFNFENLEHKARIHFLQTCWDDFEACRLTGDIYHNFGQYKNRDIVLVPGENHCEWSIRIANGLLNIIEDLENQNQSINVTHRGAIFELTNILKMIDGNITFNEIEKYETRWIEYCQDFNFEINNIKKAKELTKAYIRFRSKNENNY